MKMSTRIALLLLFAAAALPMHAQGGCVDSPEDPTLALAAIGSVGVLFTTLRARRGRRRRDEHDKQA